MLSENVATFFVSFFVPIRNTKNSTAFGRCVTRF